MSNQTKLSTFFKHFQERRQEDELMDLPTTSRKDFTEALYDIQWVNRNLGGTDALLDALRQMIPPNHRGVFSILDLATGSADIPSAIMQWAQQAGLTEAINFQITAVDVHAVAVDVARQAGQNYPEIQVVQADALNLDYADEQFDVVISSMFMHHLQNDEAAHLLREMARMCQRGLIVNDLERHPLAWLGIKAVGFLQGKGKIFKNDAPLSVLRGFTHEELIALKEAAGLPDLQIQHRRPYRWILSWQKNTGHSGRYSSPHFQPELYTNN